MQHSDHCSLFQAGRLKKEFGLELNRAEQAVKLFRELSPVAEGEDEGILQCGIESELKGFVLRVDNLSSPDLRFGCRTDKEGLFEGTFGVPTGHNPQGLPFVLFNAATSCGLCGSEIPFEQEFQKYSVGDCIYHDETGEYLTYAQFRSWELEKLKMLKKGLF